MDDKRIIELYFARDEQAIAETEKEYGALCRYIASNVLAVKEDVEECVSDVMLALWNAIPPDRPRDLRAYIGKAVRNRSHEMVRDANAWKRGGRVQIVGDEFLSLLDDGTDLSELYESRRAGELISKFLRTLGEGDRQIFLMRYFFDMSPSDIAKQMHSGESRIKMKLFRTRKKLAQYLKKEGIMV